MYSIKQISFVIRMIEVTLYSKQQIECLLNVTCITTHAMLEQQ